MALRLPTFDELDAAADKLQALFDKSGTKDNDVVGGNYIFTIKDLLKNDTNAKADTFFFGDGLDALKQDEYMKAHGIIDNHNGTYTATAGMDFSYSVWTGKGLIGSFSKADVDVLDKAAPAAPAAPAVADKDHDKPPVDNGNNAAKDDQVGVDHFTFTKDDLLANDPGGANKKDGMFFGDSAADQADQAGYLAKHGITDANGDGVYEIGVGATDFDYWVQIGNNGTWSKAHVDVNAPMPHEGDQIAKWDFEDNAITDARGFSDFGAPNGWINVSTYATQNGLGTYADQVQVTDGGNGPIQGYGAGETKWLDTAASPGNIWLQLSEANRTTNIEHDARLTVSVAKQMFRDGSGGANGDPNSHTDANATVEFWWNYEKVGEVKASDLSDANHFHDFSFLVHANADLAHDQLFIKSSGTDTTAQGLAIDHIVLRDEHLSGAEMLQNWNFEQDKVGSSGFADLASVAGWNNEVGTSNPMQVQHQSFMFMDGFASGEKQWLDSAASPGNIHIGQSIDLATGASAHLSVSVAAETVNYFNGSTTNTYQPDANDHLQFKFNDVVVKDIALSDFTDSQGHVDWNHFKTFDVDVIGGAGADHFEIVSIGNDQYTDDAGVIHGYAGFAVDHVSLQQWVI